MPNIAGKCSGGSLLSVADTGSGSCLISTSGSSSGSCSCLRAGSPSSFGSGPGSSFTASSSCLDCRRGRKAGARGACSCPDATCSPRRLCHLRHLQLVRPPSGFEVPKPVLRRVRLLAGGRFTWQFQMLRLQRGLQATDCICTATYYTL